MWRVALFLVLYGMCATPAASVDSTPTPSEEKTDTCTMLQQTANMVKTATANMKSNEDEDEEEVLKEQEQQEGFLGMNATFATSTCKQPQSEVPGGSDRHCPLGTNGEICCMNNIEASQCTDGKTTLPCCQPAASTFSIGSCASGQCLVSIAGDVCSDLRTNPSPAPPPTCTVANCATCMPGYTNYCATCKTGYTNYNGQCVAAIQPCRADLVQDPMDGKCYTKSDSYYGCALGVPRFLYTGKHTTSEGINLQDRFCAQCEVTPFQCSSCKAGAQLEYLSCDGGFLKTCAPAGY